MRRKIKQERSGGITVSASAAGLALLAPAPHSAMLANAAAPAFLADAPLSTMLAKLSKTLSRFRLSRHSNRIYRMSNTIFIATSGAVLLAHRSSRRVSQPLPTTYAPPPAAKAAR